MGTFSFATVRAKSGILFRLWHNAVVEGKYKLGSSKDPKHFDLKLGEADGPGFYTLDGDNLTIRAPAFEAQGTRPKELKSLKGSGLKMIQLMRSKK